MPRGPSRSQGSQRRGGFNNSRGSNNSSRKFTSQNAGRNPFEPYPRHQRRGNYDQRQSSWHVGPKQAGFLSLLDNNGSSSTAKNPPPRAQEKRKRGNGTIDPTLLSQDDLFFKREYPSPKKTTQSRAPPDAPNAPRGFLNIKGVAESPRLQEFLMNDIADLARSRARTNDSTTNLYPNDNQRPQHQPRWDKGPPEAAKNSLESRLSRPPKQAEGSQNWTDWGLKLPDNSTQAHTQQQRRQLQQKHPAPTFQTNAGSDFERRYQTLKRQRDVELQMGIRNGTIQDPNRPTKLSNAVTLVGTCMDMCPEFERVRRAVQRDIWYQERAVNDTSETTYNRTPDESRMVKRFQRSAAGQDAQLPSDLRPAPILKLTLDYLMVEVGGKAAKLALVHHFIWDRTRAIRNDFSIQQVSNDQDVALAMECFERIARFHIVSLHQLAQEERPYDEYDPQQEREQLDKTLLSLLQYYQDNKSRITSPHEAEFRAYQIIFQIQKSIPNLEEQIQSWGDAIIQDRRVQHALKIYRAACNCNDFQGPFRPPAQHSIAQDQWMDFWNLMRSSETSYLMGCIAEIYFPFMRRNALHAIWRAYRPKANVTISGDWPVEDVEDLLGNDDAINTEDYLTQYGFSFRGDPEDADDYIVNLGSVDSAVFPDPTIPQRCSSIVEAKRVSRNIAAVVDGLSVEDAWARGMIDREFVPDFDYLNPAPSEDDPTKPDWSSVQQEEGDDDDDEGDEGDQNDENAQDEDEEQPQITSGRAGQSLFVSDHESSDGSPGGSETVSSPQSESDEAVSTSETDATVSEGEDAEDGIVTHSQRETISVEPAKIKTLSARVKKLLASVKNLSASKNASVPTNNKVKSPYKNHDIRKYLSPRISNLSHKADSIGTSAYEKLQVDQGASRSNAGSLFTSQPYSSLQHGSSNAPMAAMSSVNSAGQQKVEAERAAEEQRRLDQQAAEREARERAEKESTELRKREQQAREEEQRKQAAALEAERQAKERALKEEEERKRQAAIRSVQETKRKKAAAEEAARQEEASRKEEVLHQLARRLLLEEGGMLDQWLVFECAPLVETVQQQHEGEKASELAEEWRFTRLQKKYGLKWREVFRKTRLKRVGRERRERHKRAVDERKKMKEQGIEPNAGRGANVMAELDVYRKSLQTARESTSPVIDTTIPRPLHHVNNTRNLTSSPNSTSTRSRHHPATASSQANGTMASAQHSNVTEKTQEEGFDFEGLTYTQWVKRKYANRPPTVYTDKTDSPYIRMKAMGLDPTPGSISPYINSTRNSSSAGIAYLEKSISARSSSLKRGRRESDHMNGHVDSQQSQTVGLVNGGDSLAMPPPRPRKSRRVSNERKDVHSNSQGSNGSSLGNSTGSNGSTQNKSKAQLEDEELFAAVAKTTEALREGSEWFREQSKLMREQDQQRLSRRNSQTSPNSSQQWAGHPADGSPPNRRLSGSHSSQEFLDGYRTGLAISARKAGVPAASFQAREGSNNLPNTGRPVSGLGSRNAHNNIGPQRSNGNSSRASYRYQPYYDPTPPPLAPLKYRQRVSKFLPRDMYADARKARGEDISKPPNLARSVESQSEPPQDRGSSPPYEQQSVPAVANHTQKSTSDAGSTISKHQLLASQQETQEPSSSVSDAASAKTPRERVVSNNMFDILGDEQQEDEDSDMQDPDEEHTHGLEMNGDVEEDFYEDEDGDSEMTDSDADDEDEDAAPALLNGKGGTSMEDAIEL